MTWGSRFDGGDSSRIQDQLKGVQQIQATSAAFVAILADGSVATWGSPDHGGDSSAVAEPLGICVATSVHVCHLVHSNSGASFALFDSV